MICAMAEIPKHPVEGHKFPRLQVSVRDLEQFANAEAPREISLSVATAGVNG
jgi:hypothetical protein